MYRTVVFFTNLWMRLFPNYREYNRWSAHAQAMDDTVEELKFAFYSRASTKDRGDILPSQRRLIRYFEARARLFDLRARECMRPITVEDLKTKPETK